MAQQLVPLETDLTTPLGFFLDNREFKGTKIATWGLLDPTPPAASAGCTCWKPSIRRRSPC